jgi:subtilisin family serine protease
MRRVQLLAAAAVAVAGLASALLIAPAGADLTPTTGLLCGVSPATDRLLGCTTSTQTATTAPAPKEEQSPTQTGTETANAPRASAAPAPGLAPGRAPVRSSTTATYLPNKLIVRFHAGVSRARQDAVLAQVGAQTSSEIPALHVRVVTVDPARRAAAAASLDRSKLVAHVERDEVGHAMTAAPPNDTNYGNQWGLRLANFPAAWQLAPAKGVLVAVVDTGVAGSLPDLAGTLRGSVNLVKGAPAADTNGHGTAVAGVIAARMNNKLGGAGVCPACTILSIKVMGSEGSGDLATSAAGIVRAAQMHAKVINVSLGGPAPLDALKAAVDFAASKGALVVAAAGNSGQAVPYYPANYPGVLSVAGTTSHDHLYGWSEHGTWIAVAAPGCNVAPLVHGGYGMFCGTSSATPLVAGLAGLAFASKPGATPAQVLAAIAGSGPAVASVAHGRIDAGKALATIKG